METKSTANYFGVAITLTANTTTHIKTAVDAVLAVQNQVSKGALREVNFQSYPGTAAGAGANTANILIGDALVDDSPLRAGYVLQPGASRLYRGQNNNVDFGSFYALSTGVDQVLLVDCGQF